MSIRDELKKLQQEAPPRPETVPKQRRNESFRDGYVRGFHDALIEALEIAEEFEGEE